MAALWALIRLTRSVVEASRAGGGVCAVGTRVVRRTAHAGAARRIARRASRPQTRRVNGRKPMLNLTAPNLTKPNRGVKRAAPVTAADRARQPSQRLEKNRVLPQSLIKMQPDNASVYDRHARREALTGAGETNQIPAAFRPSGASPGVEIPPMPMIGILPARAHW